MKLFLPLTLAIFANTIGRSAGGLVGLPPTTGPLTEQSFASCWVGGDPHYYPFVGGRYDFQGGCDTVLLRANPTVALNPADLGVESPVNPTVTFTVDVDLHVRTEEVPPANETSVPFSKITGVAFSLGATVPTILEGVVGMSGDVKGVFEIDENMDLYGTFPGEDAPTLITNPSQSVEFNGGTFSFTRTADQYKFTFGNDNQFVAVGDEGDGKGMYVSIKGVSGQLFDTATGMCGNWRKGEMTDRDGNVYNTVDVTEAEAFGLEWQVDQGDPQLFSTDAQPTCFAQRRRFLKENPGHDMHSWQQRALTLDAATACAGIPEDARGQRQACEYDVAVTEDESWGQAPTYVEVATGLLADIPEEEQGCVEIDNSNPCASKGGTIQWRCNEDTNDCDNGLAMPAANFNEKSGFPLQPGAVEGCACATDNTDPFVCLAQLFRISL